MNGEKYIRFDKRRGTYSVRVSGFGREDFSSPARSFEEAIEIRNRYLIETYGNLDYLKELRYPKQVKKNKFVLSEDCTYYTVYTTNGKTAFKISKEDLDLVSPITWFLTGKYIMSKKNGMLHRFIMNAETGIEVDHINGDRMDNRRDNLRFATHAENCRNRSKRKDKKGSNYKGVYINRYGKYQAQIKGNDGKTYSSKCFDNEVDAAIEYNKMALEHHGEFANLNKIQY